MAPSKKPLIDKTQDKKPRPLLQLALIVITIWLIGGSLVYDWISGKTWAQSFYYAVNCGYSIGFGSLADSNNVQKLFSLFMILVGAGCLSGTISFFVTRKLSSMTSIANERIEQGFSTKSVVQRYFKQYGMKGNALIFLLIWMMIGMAFGMMHEKFEFLQSILFAVGSLSTAGLIGIDKSAGDGAWIFMAIFCMVGCPTFGMVVGQFASNFIDDYIEADARKKLHSSITLDEFNLVKGAFGTQDNTIDMKEFFVLEMIRLRKTDMDQVEKIKYEFNARDKSGDGKITWSEICDRNIENAMKNHVN